LAATTSAVDEVLRGVRLLVVDDNAPSRRILRAWAERHGMVCDAVEGAEQALSLIESGARFPAAILDLMMPGIDGIELSRLLRARDPEIRQVLLSSAGPYTADLVHGEKFDAVLTKPVRPDRLFGRIATLLAGTEEPTGTDQGRQADLSSTPPMRILVVEDVLVNQKVARHLLARFGYDCDVASGGEDALAALERSDYQLVLMDVQMPGVDGLEATRRIRARWPERKVRIVALTANVGAEDVRACHDAGMDGFLGKPITLESLGAVLDQTASATAANAFIASGVEEHPEEETGAPSGPRIGDMVGPEVLEELFGLFAEGLDLTIEEIEAGCLQENSEVVTRAAHRLLGSARSLGIERLGSLCARVESYAGEGDWPRTKSLLPRMRSWQDLVRQRGPDLLR
jgi:CheY-like chemotaxis protein